MSLDLLGAEGGGFDFGTIFKAAGELAQGGISMYEQKQAKEKAAADDSAKVNAAVQADTAASVAMAKADYSAVMKAPSASIDAAAAEVASRAQDRAGSVLGTDGQAKRAKAAEAALDRAIVNAQNKPKDRYAMALVKAWTATVNKAQNVQIVSAASSGPVPDTGGIGDFLSRRVVGPVPVWGVGLAGAGVLGLLAKRYL